MSCTYCKNIEVCAICGKGYGEATRAEEAGWHPIETAPEDKHILIATTGGHVGTAYWTDEGDGKVWAWGHPQRDGGEYVHPNLTPQVWMPLPKHPADKS